jgi:two-component system LytT family response regulator
MDDEPLGRDCVRLALAGVPDAVLVGECGDGEEAVRVIREVRPDLVYLDVQMPGMGGFEVLEALGSEQPDVIFLTAYEEYALRAFAVHALDYLLKPFSNERFRESLAHAGRRIRAQEEPRTRASWLTVLQGEGRRLLKLSEVDYFTAEGNYVRVHVGAEAHLVRSTLAALLERLDPARFVRIHRGGGGEPEPGEGGGPVGGRGLCGHAARRAAAAGEPALQGRPAAAVPLSRLAGPPRALRRRCICWYEVHG